MAYRTKQFNILYKEYLKPVMDFVGITTSNDPGCGLMKYIGCDKKNPEGKAVPTYFVNQFNNNKIYTLVRSQDEFINYRSRKDDLEYFNPFVKYKNALLLLLMTTPVIYEKVVDRSFCQNDDGVDLDIVNVIVDDELAITQEEILNHVRILQYPLRKNLYDESIYSYGVEFSTDTMSLCDSELIEGITSSEDSKILAVFMLIFRIMARFEEPLPILTKACDGSFERLREMFVDTLTKYEKERELNRKDIKKLKIETEVDVYQGDELELLDSNEYESVSDALDKSSSPEDEEPENVTNITDKYKEVIPIIDKESDDDMLELDFI